MLSLCFSQSDAEELIIPNVMHSVDVGGLLVVLKCLNLGLLILVLQSFSQLNWFKQQAEVFSDWMCDLYSLFLLLSALQNACGWCSCSQRFSAPSPAVCDGMQSSWYRLLYWSWLRASRSLFATLKDRKDADKTDVHTSSTEISVHCTRLHTEWNGKLWVALEANSSASRFSRARRESAA